MQNIIIDYRLYINMVSRSHSSRGYFSSPGVFLNPELKLQSRGRNTVRSLTDMCVMETGGRTVNEGFAAQCVVVLIADLVNNLGPRRRPTAHQCRPYIEAIRGARAGVQSVHVAACEPLHQSHVPVLRYINIRSGLCVHKIWIPYLKSKVNREINAERIKTFRVIN